MIKWYSLIIDTIDVVPNTDEPINVTEDIPKVVTDDFDIIDNAVHSPNNTDDVDPSNQNSSESYTEKGSEVIISKGESDNQFKTYNYVLGSAGIFLWKYQPISNLHIKFTQN